MAKRSTKRRATELTHLIGAGVQVPRTGTEALHDFLITWAKLNRLADFLIGTPMMMDQIFDSMDGLRKALNKLDEVEEGQGDERARVTGVVLLAENSQVLFEMLVARHVDNWLSYLSGLLFHIFTSRPETLKSTDDVAVADVLAFERVADLVAYIAERRVQNLSLQGVRGTRDLF